MRHSLVIDNRLKYCVSRLWTRFFVCANPVGGGGPTKMKGGFFPNFTVIRKLIMSRFVVVTQIRIGILPKLSLCLWKTNRNTFEI